MSYHPSRFGAETRTERDQAERQFDARRERKRGNEREAEEPRRRTPRGKRDVNLAKLRSAVTNGTALMQGDIDERAPVIRRLRDLLAAYEVDLGGEAALSEGQRALIRRASMLQLQLELMEGRFRDVAASHDQFNDYQRGTNTLRRTLESLGLHRGRAMRDVTPTVEEYARQVRERPA